MGEDITRCYRNTVRLGYGKKYGSNGPTRKTESKREKPYAKNSDFAGGKITKKMKKAAEMSSKSQKKAKVIYTFLVIRVA